MQCSLCGGMEFGAMRGRPNARCLQCNSLERTRFLWLCIGKISLPPHPSILHFAPEKPLYEKITAQFKDARYVVADFSPEDYGFAKDVVKIDMCKLEGFKSEEWDLIIHSHVLEHTPCNIGYTLFHLHRMLKQTGRHVFVVPFMPGYFDETFANIDVNGWDSEEWNIEEWHRVR